MTWKKVCLMLWLMLLWNVVAFAGAPVTDPPAWSPWSVQVAGNGDTFQLAAFYRPAERVQIGLEGGYWDGLREGQHQCWTVEFVGRYFVVQDAEMNVGIGSIPTDAYVGVGLGMELSKEVDVDDIVDLRTGAIFGDKSKGFLGLPVLLGTELRWTMTDAFWSGSRQGDVVGFVTLGYQFGQ